MFQKFKDNFIPVKKICNRFFNTEKEQLNFQKDIKANDLYLGDCNGEPVILDNELTRQHVLVVGQENGKFIEGILGSLMSSPDNMLVITKIDDVTKINHIAQSIGMIDRLRIFSFAKQCPYECPPKLPFKYITNNHMNLNSLCPFVEHAMPDFDNMSLLMKYKYFFQNWLEELTGNFALSITDTFLKSPDVEKLPIWKDSDFNIKIGIWQDKIVLNQFKEKLKDILRYLNIFDDNDVMYNNDAGKQIWHDLFRNYKCIFNQSIPEKDSIIINIIQDMIGERLSLGDTRDYDKVKLYSSLPRTKKQFKIVFPCELINPSLQHVALLAAQARACGFSIFYTMKSLKQTYNAQEYMDRVDFLKNTNVKINMDQDDISSSSILANTNTKIIMNLDGSYSLICMNILKNNIRMPITPVIKDSSKFSSIVKLINI